MKRTISILSLLLVVIFSLGIMTSCSSEKQQEKYTIYFGLNDATTGKQIMTVDDAKQKLRAIFIEQGVGYTEYVAYGAYSENGQVKGNDTIIYEFYFVKKADVENVVSIAKKQLNLASLLINKESSAYYFSE